MNDDNNVLITPDSEQFAHSLFASFDSYKTMYDYSIQNPDQFWGEKLNACENCVDHHLPTKGNQVAIIWEADEPGNEKYIIYRELHREVSRLANVLRHNGIGKGDRIAIYMPMIPEAVYAMLACARVGAVHSVVFAGFSAEALRDRINDDKCKMVITADEGVHAKKIIPLKRLVAEAILACTSVKNVLVAERTGNKVPFYSPRDIWMRKAMNAERPYCPIEHVDSEDTLFLLYTSSSTGQPKGVAHTTAGYLLYTAITHKHVFDYLDGEIFACVADIGWVTGHSYVVYGPLLNGATTVLFESIPTYPNSGRYW